MRNIKISTLLGVTAVLLAIGVAVACAPKEYDPPVNDTVPSIEPSVEVSQEPTVEPTIEVTEEPTATPEASVNAPVSDGRSDGLSDGKSDGRNDGLGCAAHECKAVIIPNNAPNTGRGR